MGSKASQSLTWKSVPALVAVLLVLLPCENAIGQQGLAIPTSHPRLWWTPARIAQARTWYAAHPFTPASDDALGNAFRYICTGETSYAQNAIDLLMAFAIAQEELDGTASDTYRWADWVPLVYDGCHDRMTPTQRSTFLTRYNGYVDVLRQKDWGGPGMPANNYYTGYFRNELNWALTTYHDSPMADTFLDWALTTRWQNAFLPYSATGGGRGGVPIEGSQYGKYMLDYPVGPLTTAGLMGRDMLRETDFYKEALFYFIYASSTGPVYDKGGARQYFQMYSFSDSEFTPFPAAGADYGGDDGYGNFVMEVANEWSGVPVGAYARQVLATFPTTTSNWIAAVDTGGAATSFSGLPLDYYAPGYRSFYAKSSWNATATQAWIQIGALDAGHQHNDWGSFQILRGNRWLTRETPGYSNRTTGWGGSGTVETLDTINHNGLLFGGNDWHIGTASGYWDGQTNVTRLESRPSHAYIAADLTGVYTARTSDYLNPDGSPRDDNPFAQTVVREFLFVRPLETWLVFDRMLSCDNTRFPPTVLAADVVKTFVLHSENSPTIQDADHVLVTNGTQALRVTTLLPSSHSYSTVYDSNDAGADWSQYRLEVNHSGEAQSYFLHVLRARDSTGADVAASVSDDGPTYTVTMTHPTLGNATVVFTKGATSTGGRFGYAPSGTPALSDLTTSVQGITVTDDGPVWSGGGDTTPPTKFYTLAPCRIVDTRNPVGTYGGPALAAGPSLRVLPIAGQCGVPAAARSVVSNLTVTQPASSGYIVVHPGDEAPSGTSALNFSAGATRANNAILELSADGLGQVGVRNNSAGTVHFILDVSGYFAP